MYRSERSVQYHKQQIDYVIHRGYSRLSADVVAVAKFRELLDCVRSRAPRFLEAPVFDGDHPGVEALVNLSRFGSAHIRPAVEWNGTASSWRPAVASLANHLVCKYKVPAFLASSWYLADDPAPDEKRGWFVAHGSGASFRSLNLPIVMTRRMEQIFLASRDHLAIGPAMRRAELLGLGASEEFVQAVLSTRLATDLSNGKFWRAVWFFLIANVNVIDAGQIGPMIDFIQTIRHERLTVETPNGMVQIDPPQPAFSIKGRTIQSMFRLMRDWHGRLSLGNASLTWTSSPLQPMLLDEPSDDPSAPPKRWQMIELTHSAQLRTEGAALRHCVASYAERCRQGTSRIWSLRLRQGEKVRHVLTIEIDPKRRAVVQVRGFANRSASGKPLRLLETWVARERLQMTI